MRIKKGSRVEVMNKKEVPISWRSAEILSGNGHTYSVRYDHQPVMDGGSLIERVSRKLVRPCPPLLLSNDFREAGDTVEVFDNLSWKIASILKVLPGDYCMVRLLGCSTVSIVKGLNIRDQLLWLDDKWILMGKGSGACGLEQISNLSTKYCRKMGSDALRQKKAQKSCLHYEEDAGLQESRQNRSRSLKRAALCWPSVIESHAGNSHKRRVVEKDNRRHKMATPLAVREVFVGSDEPITRELNFPAGFPLLRDLHPSDSDSVASSVGSCSINSMGQKGSPKYYKQVLGQESNCICSDAESFSKDDEECCSLPYEDEVFGSSHDIELEAYRRTLLALHSSGPLSWEQESILTNLRIDLHVSDDEHLMEIRYLLSDQNGAHHK